MESTLNLESVSHPLNPSNRGNLALVSQSKIQQKQADDTDKSLSEMDSRIEMEYQLEKLFINMF